MAKWCRQGTTFIRLLCDLIGVVTATAQFNLRNAKQYSEEHSAAGDPACHELLRVAAIPGRSRGGVKVAQQSIRGVEIFATLPTGSQDGTATALDREEVNANDR